ncbi:MAG: heavy metal-associated domain-containing protein [Verrucomicrobiota bacterium]|nr:heavy metal-associated domain-containing protein [Verrucomicrobiota bacterium]MEC7907979.1 heavy metal-associated domain-containing protein [Verrucomicrobiota bacterium]MEC8517959.1 heavy metal-associated domain-containing protein [Verrucomicrobiota bacterium]MEC8753248.1 heavy metal-associated domain-containing protein [Verrucomicrobiota bacterium]
MLNKLNTIILILVVSIYSLESSGSEGDTTCSKEMITLLEDNPNTVVLKVKGLVCSSCAIGVRIHLSRMDGIDISKFNKGIMLDSTSQYVLVAIKDNIDFQKINESITNAGYNLHHLCYIDNGLVKRINFNT